MRGAVVAALVAALSGPAVAQQRSSPLASHLPLKTEACFGKTYDAEHLRQNPKQRVTRFHLFRDFTVDKAAESPPLSAGEFLDRDGEGGHVGLMAYVGFRDKPGVFTNWLGCQKSSDGKGAHCGVECDGGGFKLGARDKALLVENEGFVVTGGCGANEDDQERRDFVKPGEADRRFVLDPLPLAQCTAIRDSLKPAWTKLGAPIRERLAKNDAVCFSRSYDAAHLAKHPQQTVRRIAVFKPRGGKMLDDTYLYELTFSIELKDGRKLTKKTTCQPSKYAYGCTHDPALDTVEDFYLTRAGENQIMLRDKRARLEKLFGAALGADDRIFRLSASAADACRF
jgi:hypothetical protein